METLQRTANRGSISTGYDIDNSLKLERANSEAIIATNSTQSGNRKTWTFSTWIKRTEISYNGAFGVNALFYAASSGMQINSSDKIVISLYASAGLTGSFTTSQVFRDTSAWYHIVLTVDTTESTSTNRVKLWINGQQVTNFDTATYPNLNDEFNFGEAQSAAPIRIGNAYWGTSPFSAYIAETHYLNGTAKQASDFGEYDADSGIWIPKEYTDGGYGDIGFYYKYDNASSLGEDSSGEGHDASSLNNITSADQATDTPTNNFCTLNQVMLTQANTVISQGATSLFSTGASGNTVVGTMGVSRGKWYWEFKHISAGGTAYWSAIGYTSSESTDSTQTAGGNSGYPSHVALLPNGGTFTNGTILGGKFNTFSPNDIAGVALDMDNGDMYLYKNGTIQNSGNPIFTSIGDFAMPVGSVYLNGCGGYFNFGGFTSYTPSSAATDANGYGTFEYAPPSGYYALCTKNLAEYG